MVNLQVGHSVKVRSPKPEWRDMHPNFIRKMDEFVGQVFKVSQVINKFGGDKTVYLEGTTSYQWRLEWLELTSRSTIQNGDLL